MVRPFTVQVSDPVVSVHAGVLVSFPWLGPSKTSYSVAPADACQDSVTESEPGPEPTVVAVAVSALGTAGGLTPATFCTSVDMTEGPAALRASISK